MRADWQRNQKYGMYEYACHEGDVQVHNYIVASRAQRAADAQKLAEQQAQPPAAATAAAKPAAKPAAKTAAKK